MWRGSSPTATAFLRPTGSTSSTTSQWVGRGSMGCRFRHRRASSTSTSTARFACASLPRWRARPTLFAAIRVLAGNQAGAAGRRLERQAGDHRARPRGHAGPVNSLVAAVLRNEQAAGGRREPACLLRGHECAAFRRVHRHPGAAGIRLALRAAALLFHPGDGPDVRASEEWRAVARESSRSYRAARRNAGRGAADHAANVPPIGQTPAGGDSILFSGGTLQIPD